MMSAGQENPLSLAPGAVEIIKADHTVGRWADTYQIPFTGESVAAIQAQPRQAERIRKKPEKSPVATGMSTAESRAAFRLHWTVAKAAANAMVGAAELDDRMGLGIAADDLEHALSKLWELRDGRDVDWKTILNHAQGMMRLFFQEGRAECLTAEQCRNIAALVKEHLGPATKTIDDLNEALRLIDDAGFDPYAAISADPTDGE